MKKIVYFDCDGVISDLEPILFKLVRKVNPLVEKITSYNIVSHELSKERLNSYFRGEEFSNDLKKMKPIDGAINGMNRMYNFLDESNILTIRNSYSEIEADTKNWFESVNGKYHNLFFEKYKADFIKNNGMGLLVEDCPENINVANKLGIPCICVPHDYNAEIREEGSLLRVRSWINDGSRKSNIEECVRYEFDWKNMKFFN